MNNKYLAISLSGLLSLGLVGCFTDSTSSLPTVPTSSQVLFEIPASLVLGSDQDTAMPMSMAKLNPSLLIHTSQSQTILLLLKKLVQLSPRLLTTWKKKTLLKTF
jgi:hypothetical protein